jgi:hypothetical protein
MLTILFRIAARAFAIDEQRYVVNHVVPERLARQRVCHALGALASARVRSSTRAVPDNGRVAGVAESIRSVRTMKKPAPALEKSALRAIRIGTNPVAARDTPHARILTPCSTGRRAEIQHVPPDILRVTPRIELRAMTQAGGIVPVHINSDALVKTWTPRAQATLRIVVGFLFLQHGTAKLFGVPHVPAFDHLTLFSLVGCDLPVSSRADA